MIFPGDLVRFYHDFEAPAARPPHLGSVSKIFCWRGTFWKHQHVYGDETFIGNVLAVAHWADFYEKKAFASKFSNVFSRATVVLIVDVIALRQELMNSSGDFVHIAPGLDELNRFVHGSIVLLPLTNSSTYATVEAIR